MEAMNKETIYNGLCLGLCVIIGALTSMGLLGVNPNTLNDKDQICKHYEQPSPKCQKR